MSTNIIKQLRESCGVTKVDLARAINVSPSKIYDLEHQRRQLKEEDLKGLSGFFAEKIELAYVAGLFDRSSSITITKILPYKIHHYQVSPTYIARIHFNSKYKLLCSIIKEVMGVGAVSVRDHGKYWNYYAHCASVDTVIEKLLPYIRLKREKFLIMKEFRDLLEQYSGGWVDSVRQDTGAKDWWTTRETVAQLGFSSIAGINNQCSQGRLICKKVIYNNQYGAYQIAPITNLEQLLPAARVPQNILDRYEELYNRIRQM